MDERIPQDSVANPGKAAADIVIATMKEVGIDPRKAIIYPMMQELCARWAYGDLAREEFINACNVMLIFNPDLKLK